MSPASSRLSSTSAPGSGPAGLPLTSRSRNVARITGRPAASGASPLGLPAVRNAPATVAASRVSPSGTVTSHGASSSALALGALRLQTVPPDLSVSTQRPLPSTATSRARSCCSSTAPSTSTSAAIQGPVPNGPDAAPCTEPRYPNDSTSPKRTMASAKATRVAAAGAPPGVSCGPRAGSSSTAGADGAVPPSRTAHTSPPATSPTTATIAARRGQRPGSWTTRRDDASRPPAPLPDCAASGSVVTRDSMGMGA
jgi:hypothetical protein